MRCVRERESEGVRRRGGAPTDYGIWRGLAVVKERAGAESDLIDGGHLRRPGTTQDKHTE